MSKYVIGLDYGTDSARAYIVDAATGAEQGTAVKYIPAGPKACTVSPLPTNTANTPQTMWNVWKVL